MLQTAPSPLYEVVTEGPGPYLDQVIDYDAGAVELTYARLLTSSVEIPADRIELSLSTSDEPGTWTTPDATEVRDAPAGQFAVAVQLLLGADLVPPAGLYRLWVRAEVGDQHVPRRSPGWIRIAGTLPLRVPGAIDNGDGTSTVIGPLFTVIDDGDGTSTAAGFTSVTDNGDGTSVATF